MVQVIIMLIQQPGCNSVLWTPLFICAIIKEKVLGAVVHERKDPDDTGERSV